MFEPERIEKLAELLKEASDAHAEAFAAEGGSDPEWPKWFAERIHEDLNEILGSRLEPERIATLLAEAEEEHLITSPGREWPGYYAEFLIAVATTDTRTMPSRLWSKVAPRMMFASDSTSSRMRLAASSTS